MRRTVTGVTAFLLPLLTVASAGCGQPTVEAKTKSAESVSIDRRSLDPPLPKAPVQASVPGHDFPLDADVRVQSAVFNTKGLRDAEEKLYELFRKELKPAISRSQVTKDLDSPQAALPSIQKAARTLREMAEDVIKSHAAFEIIAEKYEKDLARGPAAYQLAAVYYREKSDEATERVFKDGYQTHASNCDILAVVVRERARVFTKFRADVGDAIAFTRKTAAYLRDIEHYCSLASPIDSAELTRSYREHLKVYVRSFAEFVNLYEEWSASLRKRPLPQRPSDPVAPVSPSPSGSEEAYPPGRFVSHVRTLTDSAESASLEAENAGRSFERFFRELKAECGELNERMAGHTLESLPPAVRAERDRYLERVNTLRTITQLKVSGTDAQLSVTSTERIPPGTVLPCFRGTDFKFVGIVRVSIVHGASTYPLTLVRGGPLKFGDKVVIVPPGHLSLQPATGRAASW